MSFLFRPTFAPIPSHSLADRRDAEPVPQAQHIREGACRACRLSPVGADRRMVSVMKPAVRAASVALALALGGAGAIIAWLASVPAPFILGPAVAVTVAGVAGLRTEIPTPLRNAAFVVIGAIMGSGVTPDVPRGRTGSWPLSFLALGLTLVVIMAVTTAMLRRVWRLRPRYRRALFGSGSFELRYGPWAPRSAAISRRSASCRAYACCA